MTDTCIACGMRMDRPEDYALGDVSKDFCAHCTQPDGSMKSYDEVLEGITGYLMRSEGLEEDAAREKAKGMMARLPAWKERSEGVS